PGRVARNRGDGALRDRPDEGRRGQLPPGRGIAWVQIGGSGGLAGVDPRGVACGTRGRRGPVPFAKRRRGEDRLLEAEPLEADESLDRGPVLLAGRLGLAVDRRRLGG